MTARLPKSIRHLVINCRKVVVVLDIVVWQAHLWPALVIGLAAFMQGITSLLMICFICTYMFYELAVQ